MDDKARNRVLLVLFIGVLMGALAIAIVVPALPTIRDYFGVHDCAGGADLDLRALYLVSTPLMAKLSVFLSLGGARSTSWMLPFSPPVRWWFHLRDLRLRADGWAIQGLGAGGIFPVALAALRTFPPEKRGCALGLIGAVFGLAFIIGPYLGGVLLMAGWRWLFLINLPVAAVVIVMALRVPPTACCSERLRFDWARYVDAGRGAGFAGLWPQSHRHQGFRDERHDSSGVAVDNDVNIMALGEQRYGDAVGLDHFIFIKIGTGIGSGIISNGKIHRGQ